MSVSAVTSIASLGSLPSLSSVSSVAKTPTAAIASATHLDSPDSSPAILAEQTAQLLKDLANGNVTAARTDLIKLTDDLKAEQGSATSTFEKVIAKLSSALDSGNASGALSTLANYLVQSGSGSGSVIDAST